MSTRANIVFLDTFCKENYQYISKNANVILYNHSDGYPEGLGADLKEFFKLEPALNNLHDAEYLSAWCLKYIMDNGYDVSKSSDWNDYDGKGFGICETIHTDIDYLYVYYSDIKELRTYEYDYYKLELVETVKCGA